MSAISAWFNGLITDITLWFDGFSADFYTVFIKKDRYEQMLTGLLNTLKITAGAVKAPKVPQVRTHQTSFCSLQDRMC